MKEKEKSRQLRDALRRLIVANGTLKKAERPCGTPLTQVHAYALLELLEHGEMTVSALAEKLSIDRTNVSRLCSRMEKEGDLSRRVSKHDQRVKNIRLTRKGKSLAKRVDQSSVNYFEEMVGELGESTQEVISALECLENVMIGEKNEDE